MESDATRETFFAAGNGLFTGTDGRNRDRMGEIVAGASAWGSDIAGVQSPCGSTPMFLASKSDDALEQDQIQVYEIGKGQATPVSEPMEVPGPVTAPWPSATRGQA